jgi:hypothetical protein
MSAYLGRRWPFWREMWSVAGCYVCAAGTAGGRIAGIWARRSVPRFAETGGRVVAEGLARCMGRFQGTQVWSGQGETIIGGRRRWTSCSLAWFVLGRLDADGGFCSSSTRQKAVARSGSGM